MSTSHAATRRDERRARGIFLSMMLTGTIALIGWTIYLGWQLPRVYVAAHWRLAWVGLDSVQIVLLTATTYAAYRRLVVIVLLSSASGALFVIDAWFDVTTARSGAFHDSLIAAVFVELPAGVMLCGVAYVALRRALAGREKIDGTAPIWRQQLPAIEP